MVCASCWAIYALSYELTTAERPTRLPSNSKCVNRNSALSVPQSISPPRDRKILFLGSVCSSTRMCVFVRDHIMPHAGGLVGSCRDEYNVDEKRKISGIYFGVGINYIDRCWLQTQSGETVEVNRLKHRQEAYIWGKLLLHACLLCAMVGT